jgi:hypothetical protein
MAGVSGQSLASSLILLSNAVPLILPSSGSMANNGALTGIAPIQAAYANAWVALPASAIFAGSAAGTYFAQFSSTSAATVFNNQPSLVGNVIPIPATPTPFVTTGPGAYAQTVGANVTAFSFTLPANSMGKNGRIRMTGNFSNINTANNKLGQLGFGATSIAGASNTTNLSQPVMHDIINKGVTGTQQVLGGSGYVVSAAAPALPANDTTTPLLISFFLQNTVAAADSCQWDWVMVELLPIF